jgi:hypothetical protein
LTLMSQTQFVSFRTAMSASIGVLPARSSWQSFWRAFVMVQLVAKVLLSEVQSYKRICDAGRLDLESLEIYLYCSGISCRWAGWEEAPGKGSWLWVAFMISKVQSLLVSFLLVGTDPFTWNGQSILNKAVCWPDLFNTDPR